MKIKLNINGKEIEDNYQKVLQERYDRYTSTTVYDISKLEFVANDIFEMITDDSRLDEEFATDMIEVIKVILDRRNFDYISDEQNYKKYILMCNMPFLRDKIECGTSIRGAWIDDSGDKKFEMACGQIIVPQSEICVFLNSLIAWLNK